MILLPGPRRLIRTEGMLALPAAGLIQLLSSAVDLLPAARALQGALQRVSNVDYGLVAGGPGDGVVVDPLLTNHLPHDQAYELEIEPAGIHLTAATAEGAFWG